MDLMSIVLREKENPAIKKIYEEHDVNLQKTFEERPLLHKITTPQEMDKALDICDTSNNKANILIGIMDKAIFFLNQEIKDIKKDIRHIELQEDVAFDGLNQEIKKNMSKAEYEKFKKTTIELKVIELQNQLDDKKIILEYAEFELKRVLRIKEQFNEYNMNLKKKYQLMM